MEYGRSNMRRRGPRYNQDQARLQNCSVEAGPGTNASNSLFHQLQECREELVRQKHLKEIFINREKATRKEMESLKRASDLELKLKEEDEDNIREKEALQKKVVALKFNIDALKDNASKKEKSVVKFLMDLKDKQISSSRAHATKLHAEEEVSQALRTQLSQLKEEHQDRIRAMEALEKNLVVLEGNINTLKDIASVNEKTQFKDLEDLKEHLQTQRSHEMDFKIEIKKMSEDLEATKQLMAEKDVLVHHMEEQIQTLEDNTSEKEKTVLEDLKDIKHNQALINLEHATKLHAEEEVSQALRTQLSQLKEEHLKIEIKKMSENLEATKQLMAEEHLLAHHMEEQIQGLEDAASEMRLLFLKDLEDLKEPPASTSQERVTETDAEDDVSYDLQTKEILNHSPNVEVLKDIGKK